MMELVMLAIFAVAGLGMAVGGFALMCKDRRDPESVKVYGVMALIGAVVLAVVIFYFLSSDLASEFVQLEA